MALELYKKRATDNLNEKVAEHKKNINLSAAKETDLEKIREIIKDLKEFKDSSLDMNQRKAAFEENSSAKSFLEELEKKEKELTSGTTPSSTETGGKETGGKETGGKETGGKETGGKETDKPGGDDKDKETPDSLREKI